ncbi:MAG: hypothetical protein ABWW66_01935 [Archaeoglobaceae archaeon]
MKYSFFARSELEELLSSLKGAKPKFRAMRRVELIAEFEGGVVGRYGDLLFVFGEFEGLEPLKTIEVELSSGGDFKPFAYGRYKIGEKIFIDSEFRDELFYDALPALLAEIARAEVVAKECDARALHLKERERSILAEVARLTKEAERADRVELESLPFRVTEMRSDFFSSYMQFRDALGELQSSVYRAEVISTELGGLLAEMIEELKFELEKLSLLSANFRDTLEGIENTLDVVHLRIEMIRGEENLELQRRTSALQAAAAVIEYVAVFYYTMKIWESFLPVKDMPEYASFTILAFFSLLVVLYTEALGDYLVERRVTKKLVAETAMLVAILVLMAIAPTLLAAL